MAKNSNQQRRRASDGRVIGSWISFQAGKRQPIALRAEENCALISTCSQVTDNTEATAWELLQQGRLMRQRKWKGRNNYSSVNCYRLQQYGHTLHPADEQK